MSNMALTAAWEGSRADGSAFTVLLALADQANDDGHCWPSIDHIARRSRVSRRTAQVCLDKLYTLGEVSKVRRGGRVGDQRFTNVYRVAVDVLMSNVQISHKDNLHVQPGALHVQPAAPQPSLEPSLPSSSSKAIEEAALDAEVDRVAEHFYRESGKKQPTSRGADEAGITPSQRTMLRRAVKEAGLGQCLDAVNGLVAWHKKRGGSLALGRVFTTRPGGSPLTEQVEWWAAQGSATVREDSGFIPSDDAARVSAAKRTIRRSITFNDSNAQEMAGKAQAFLSEHGITTTITLGMNTHGVEATFVSFSDESEDA